MSDELEKLEAISVPSPDAAPVETTLERKKREDRERKRRERAEKRLKESEDQSFETKKGIITEQWERNLKKLSQTAKAELNGRVSYFNYIVGDILNRGAHRMAANEEYGNTNDKFIEMRPERWLNEVEDYVTSHPVHEETEFDFESLAGLSPSFQQFGLDIDNAPSVAYFAFLHYLKLWLAKNYRTLELAVDPDDLWSCDWQRVEELCAANPRLGRITPRSAAEIQTASPVVACRLTEAEQIQKTISDLRSADSAAFEI